MNTASNTNGYQEYLLGVKITCIACGCKVCAQGPTWHAEVCFAYVMFFFFVLPCVSNT